MRGSFRLGRIAGIEISVNYTWLAAFAIISWSQAEYFFPQQIPEQSLIVYWLLGMLSAILLFASVLLHELAHSLYARSRGIPVNSIVFFIFGGVSNISQETQRPRDELLMALFGPLTSLAIAAIAWGLLQFAGTGSYMEAILLYLALINALLAAFNLLPGFPLDGGRVLRAIIWGTTGNITRATTVAATVGQIFGWLLIGYGIFSIFTGNFMGGIWITFIGWFLNGAAGNSKQESTLKEHLRGVRVRDVMETNPETVNPGTLVADIVHDFFFQRGRHAVAVTEDGRLLGIITLTNVKSIPQEKWPDTRVAEVMTRSPLYSVAKDAELQSAFNLIAEHDLNQVLVLEDERVVGILSRADIVRYLHLSRELRFPAKSPASR
ncbi:MAG: site-2 protease family protein [Dehalococcoidales bacterium]|jgi:Zn-dependent protease/CBS domain-containing protein